MKFTTEVSNLMELNHGMTSAEAHKIVADKWLKEGNASGIVSYILTNWHEGNCVDYMYPIADKILDSKEFELHIKLWKTTIKRQEEQFLKNYRLLKNKNLSYAEILTVPFEGFNEFRMESYTNSEKTCSFFLNRITNSLKLWILQVENHKLKSDSISSILETLKKSNRLKYDNICYTNSSSNKPPTHRPQQAMKPILKKLLDSLDAISEVHEEVGDTDVREQMYEALHHAFIIQTPGYTLPTTFGMFEPEGNAAVLTALSEFIPAACGAGLLTPQERFAAFQDNTVLSNAGNPYDAYFGHSDNFDELSNFLSQPSTPSVTPSKKPWWKFW